MLDSLGGLLIPEIVDDAASSIIDESFAELASMIIGVCSTIEGLDVFGV
jgi:hypothetical protein